MRTICRCAALRICAATFKAASGAALGRLAGTLGKLLVAVVVWVLLVVAAFVP